MTENQIRVLQGYTVKVSYSVLVLLFSFWIAFFSLYLVRFHFSVSGFSVSWQLAHSSQEYYHHLLEKKIEQNAILKRMQLKKLNTSSLKTLKCSIHSRLCSTRFLLYIFLSSSHIFPLKGFQSPVSCLIILLSCLLESDSSVLLWLFFAMSSIIFWKL